MPPIRPVALALVLAATATPLAAQGFLETRRTYHGCDVLDGVTLSCATIQLQVYAAPRFYDFGTVPPTPVGSFWFGWESLGSSATFFTPGNLDPAPCPLTWR